MSKRKTQFDFKRYGRILVILGILAGLYLSRNAASCFKDQVDKFNLAGEVDDGTNTSLIDDKGGVKKGTKGDYADNFQEGSGFFGYMFRSVPYCVDRSPFKNPVEVYYAFLGLMGLGLLFLGLDRVIKPNWKKNLKDDNEQERKRKRDIEETDRMARSARAKPEPKKIEAIEVDFGGGTDVGDMLMSNDDHVSSSSTPARRAPSGGSATPMSSRKKAELADLGLGGQDWLNDDDDDFVGDAGKPSASEPRSDQDARPAMVGGLMNTGPTSADEALDAPPAPRPSRALRGGGPPRVVAAQATDTDAMPNSPASRSVINPLEDRSQLWVPSARAHDPFIYVAPWSPDPGPGLRDGERLNRATNGIAAGIESAQRYLDKGQSVQLRLLPGVYAEQIDLPPGVALINHNIPRNLTTDELRFWLTGDEGFDHQHHVVLALPPDAPPDARIVTSVDSEELLLAGLHLVGRAELEDNVGEEAGGGVYFERVLRADLFLCHLVGHRLAADGAALEVRDCGDESTGRVLMQDCLIELNASSGRGGAIFIQNSAVALRGCAIQANTSATAGGAIYIEDTPRPLLFEDCSISDNGVQLPGHLPGASRAGWSGEVGHGGGIYISNSSLRLRRTDITENGAQGAGGGIFATASRLLVEGTDDPGAPPSRIAANEALRGGGILLSGDITDNKEQLTALKATNVEFIANNAQESGGAIAAFRLAHVELSDCGILQNQVSAEHGEGGGIHANLGARVKLTGTSINRNSAPLHGGGMAICNSSLRLLDGCSVTENRAEIGDAGGVSFYTMESQFIAELKARQLMEDPVVCAVAACNISHNHANQGVGGLFIGNYVKQPTNPIAFALKAPELIGNNTIDGPDGEPIDRTRATGSRPVDLLILWKGSPKAGDNNPPTGKRILK